MMHKGKMLGLMIVPVLALSILSGCASVTVYNMAEEKPEETLSETAVEAGTATETETEPEAEAETGPGTAVEAGTATETETEPEAEAENEPGAVDEVDTVARIISEINEDVVMKDREYDLYDLGEEALDREFMFSENQQCVVLLKDELIDDIFDTRDYTLGEVISIIEDNPDITDEFKEFMEQFVIRMDNYYDGLDYRMFAANAQKLKVILEDPETIHDDSGAKAYFDNQHGEMHLPDKIDYSNEYYKIIIRHELGHMFNNYTTKPENSDYEFTYSPGYYGHGINLYEAVDVIFTRAPFIDEYSEKRKENLGYSLIVNELDLLLDGTDYDLKNCVADNVYDLEEYLRKNTDIEDPNRLVDELEHQWYEYKKQNINIGVDTSDYLVQTVMEYYFRDKDMNGYGSPEDAKADFTDAITRGVKTENMNMYTIDRAFNKYMEETT